MALTLIRHGLTIYNEEKKYLGWTDLPLSERGKREIQWCSEQITEKTHDLLITSDLLRCMETAELLFPRQPSISLSILREFDFGDWEGKTYGQLKEVELYQQWLENPKQITPPKGESLQQFKKRTNEAFFEILTLAEVNQAKNVAVVCHGGVIRQWLSTFSPVERELFEWSVPINCRFKLEGSISDLRRGLKFISLQEEPIMVKIDGH